jgi:hypothetical protein
MAGWSFIAGMLTNGAIARRCICTFPASTATCGNAQALKSSQNIILCESLIKRGHGMHTNYGPCEVSPRLEPKQCTRSFSSP